MPRSPKETVKTNEQRRIVENSVRETGRFLFPFLTLGNRKINEYREKYGPASTAPEAEAEEAARLFTAIFDIVRLGLTAFFVNQAVNADSTKGLIGWPVAAGVVLLPNIIHLLSKVPRSRKVK